jgi:hypothetical protein
MAQTLPDYACGRNRNELCEPPTAPATTGFFTFIAEQKTERIAAKLALINGYRG